MLKVSNRLEKLEKAVQIEHDGQEIILFRRLSGKEAEQAQKDFILQQARSRLGLCEPSRKIFLSRRLKLIREDHPNFPYGMSEDEAKQLIKEFDDDETTF